MKIKGQSMCARGKEHGTSDFQTFLNRPEQELHLSSSPSVIHEHTYMKSLTQICTQDHNNFMK
jgi:hypothetical protein